MAILSYWKFCEQVLSTNAVHNKVIDQHEVVSKRLLFKQMLDINENHVMKHIVNKLKKTPEVTLIKPVIYMSENTR